MFYPWPQICTFRALPSFLGPSPCHPPCRKSNPNPQRPPPPTSSSPFHSSHRADSSEPNLPRRPPPPFSSPFHSSRSADKFR
ncbi:hypothetical protein Droror1_Dr00026955, partial [Drosera rotundifolia]